MVPLMPACWGVDRPGMPWGFHLHGPLGYEHLSHVCWPFLYLHPVYAHLLPFLQSCVFLLGAVGPPRAHWTHSLTSCTLTAQPPFTF